MSAEKSHEWLIDALYPEHDEREPSTASGELDDLDQRDELLAIQRLLDRTRQELVPAAPRPEISRSILEAASTHATRHADTRRADVAPRRAAGSPASSSLWSRAQRRGLLQVVAVLCVCLGAGLIVKNMSSSSSSPASYDAAATRSTAAMALEQPTAAPMAEGEAMAMAEATPPAESSDFPDVAFDEAPNAQDKTLALGDERLLNAASKRDEARSAPSAASQEPAPPRQQQKSARAKEVSPRPAKKAVSMPFDDADKSEEAETSSRGVAILDELSDTGVSRNTSAPKRSTNSIFGGGEGAAAKPTAPPATTPRADTHGNSSAQAAGPSAPAEPVAPQSDIKARAEAAKDAREAESEDVLKNAPTLEEVERQYARDNYARALEEAELYLKVGIGSNRERARAMELKAEALGKLGRGNEADQVYEQIRQKYPDYFRKENLQTKKKAAPSERQRRAYDFEESPAQEQAY